MGTFKRLERIFLVLMAVGSMTSLCFGLFLAITGWSNASRWLATSGLLFTLTALVQLEVCGFFQKLIDHFGDVERYPYGPPSYITREIIDSPDQFEWLGLLRDRLFYQASTGFWLTILGVTVEIVAVWV